MSVAVADSGQPVLPPNLHAADINDEISRATEQLYANLNLLSEEPLTENRIELAKNVNDWFVYIVELTSSLMLEAGTTITDMSKQRDRAVRGLKNAVREHRELVYAIANQDPNHPLVQEIMTLIREDERQNIDDEVGSAQGDAYKRGYNAGYDEAKAELVNIVASNLELRLPNVDIIVAQRVAVLFATGNLPAGWTGGDLKKLRRELEEVFGYGS